MERYGPQSGSPQENEHADSRKFRNVIVRAIWVKTRRLRWAGHISRMGEERTPHQIAFSELKNGRRPSQKPNKRWMDRENSLELGSLDGDTNRV